LIKRAACNDGRFLVAVCGDCAFGGTLVAGRFFFNTKSFVGSVGTESLESIRGRTITRLDLYNRTDLTATKDGSAGGGEVVEHNVVGAFGKFECATR
jgi:hypothetical protein